MHTPNPIKLAIAPTQFDLIVGTANSCTECPVARSINQAICPGSDGIARVFNDASYITLNRQTYRARHSPTLSQYIRDITNYVQVKPRKFTLTFKPINALLSQ